MSKSGMIRWACVSNNFIFQLINLIYNLNTQFKINSVFVKLASTYLIFYWTIKIPGFWSKNVSMCDVCCKIRMQDFCLCIWLSVSSPTPALTTFPTLQHLQLYFSFCLFIFGPFLSIQMKCKELFASDTSTEVRFINLLKIILFLIL